MGITNAIIDNINMSHANYIETFLRDQGIKDLLMKKEWIQNIGLICYYKEVD